MSAYDDWNRAKPQLLTEEKYVPRDVVSTECTTRRRIVVGSWLIVAYLFGCRQDPELQPIAQPELAFDVDDDLGTPFNPYRDIDFDGDGFSRSSGDCDDSDSSIYPDAPDVCDGVDSDCGGDVEPDTDGDGAFDCVDCDVLDPTIHSGAPDPFGDGLDSNCDGTDGVGLASDMHLLGGQHCGELGTSIDVLDLDGDGVEELIVGAPNTNYNCGYPLSNDRVYLLSETTVLDYVQTATSNQANGMHVEGYQTSTGHRRVASVALNDPPGNTLRVYELDGVLFAGNAGMLNSPALEIRGTTTLVAGVAADSDPATWLAVAAIASASNNATISLFSPDDYGQFGVEEAPGIIVSTNQHPSTGQWMEVVGDRDGDGRVDLGVGAPGGRDANDAVGRAYVLTPGIHQVLEEGLEAWVGDNDKSLTGVRVRGGADLDGDGLPEMVVGSPYEDNRRGRVDVAPWLGPGVHELYAQSTATVAGEFAFDGAADVALTDADQDGFGDLVVGMPSEHSSDVPGKALLFHGPVFGNLESQHASRIWVGTDPGGRFGYELVTADVDGSGFPDLVLGAPWQDSELPDAGAVHIVYDFGL